MDITLVLFVLRVASAMVLGAFVLAIAALLYRDLRQAAHTQGSARRSYGQIVALLPMDGKLVKTGTSHPLTPYTSFGRAPTNTIQLEDSATSNEHATLTQKGVQWWLEDRNSRNGTTLNGTPIDRPVIITHGDIIGIGKLHFRIDFTDAPA
ncbi:MAG: FHA domain-containing protein [Anaerolineae bacterium]|nr:FHA domain-containing protein [Anaerolineae bacterium]